VDILDSLYVNATVVVDVKERSRVVSELHIKAPKIYLN
jgi:hypothetical protein